MDADPAPNTTFQLPLIDVTGGVSFPREMRKLKARKLKINDMLSQVRQLHEQINTYLHQCPAAERPSINSPTEAADLLRPFIATLLREEMWLILLNRRNKVMQIVKLYQGNVSASQVREGEVFRQAIIEQASAIILAPARNLLQTRTL